MKREREHRKWIIFCTNKERAVFHFDADIRLFVCFAFQFSAYCRIGRTPQKSRVAQIRFVVFPLHSLSSRILSRQTVPGRWSVDKKRSSWPLYTFQKEFSVEQLPRHSQRSQSGCRFKKANSIANAWIPAFNMVDNSWKTSNKRLPLHLVLHFSIWFSFAFNELLFH